MIIYIKNMVCNRCVMAVKDTFEKVGLVPVKVTLGEVMLAEQDVSQEKLDLLDKELEQLGFERIDDKKSRIIEQVKNIIINSIHHLDEASPKYKWSEVLMDKLHHDYKYLSHLFSTVEGITIEQYIIKQKIEKAKELLVYDELSLGEIAYKLGYSSVAHLSNQFKKVTGLTPSFFKQLKEDKRTPLDQL